MNSHVWRHIGTLWRQKQKLIVGILALAFVVQLAMGSVAEAQYVSPSGKQYDPDNPWSFAMSFGADKFFGFYPIVAGTYKLRKDFGIAFGSTVYQHLGSQGPLHSTIFSNPWILVHIGIHKEFFDGKLIIRPEVGFTNGQILSSGNDFFGTQQPYAVFDGWLTKIGASYTTDLVEGTTDAAYVSAWRHEGPAVSGYLHLISYTGLRLSKNVSFGPYYENLWMTMDHGAAALPAQDLYAWLGPAIRVKVPSLGFSLMVTGGYDFSNVLNQAGNGVSCPGTGNFPTGPGGTCTGPNTSAGKPNAGGANYFKIIWTKTF